MLICIFYGTFIISNGTNSEPRTTIGANNDANYLVSSESRVCLVCCSNFDVSDSTESWLTFNRSQNHEQRAENQGASISCRNMIHFYIFQELIFKSYSQVFQFHFVWFIADVQTFFLRSRKFVRCFRGKHVSFGATSKYVAFFSCILKILWRTSHFVFRVVKKYVDKIMNSRFASFINCYT